MRMNPFVKGAWALFRSILVKRWCTFMGGDHRKMDRRWLFSSRRGDFVTWWWYLRWRGDVNTEWDPRADLKAQATRIATLEGELLQVNKRLFRLENIVNNDKMVSFYTGLDSPVLHA